MTLTPRPAPPQTPRPRKLPVLAVALTGTLMALSFAAGRMTMAPPPPPVTRAVFGFLDHDLDAFPECQTDMEMSTAWSSRLMYLNGVWTAGCVDEHLRRNGGDARPQAAE